MNEEYPVANGGIVFSLQHARKVKIVDKIKRIFCFQQTMAQCSWQRLQRKQIYMENEQTEIQPLSDEM